MKLVTLLPLAALTTAFVIPDEQVMSEVNVESHGKAKSIIDKLPTKHQVITEFEDTFSRLIDTSKSAFDQAIDYAAETGEEVSTKAHETAFDTQAWLESATNRVEDLGKHGKHGHHGHGKPNLTVYQLIAESKYTTKLAALVNEFPDVVELLNGTAANYTVSTWLVLTLQITNSASPTACVRLYLWLHILHLYSSIHSVQTHADSDKVFAPTDSAFEKIPEHAPKPSKEVLKKILLYHVSEEFFPAGRVLVTHTIPSLLSVETLGIGPQRLGTEVSLKGLTVNFYSRIVAIDIVRFHAFSPWSILT